MDGDQSSDLTGVVDSVMHVFGEVMSRDAVCAIVEHCGGDLTLAIETIVNMSSDDKANIPESKGVTVPIKNETSQSANPAQGLPVAQNPPTTSYAGASRASGTFPKPSPKQKPTATPSSSWTIQMQQIVDYHTQGSRTLVLMRGLPGSGKSFLARELLEAMNLSTKYEAHVFSTDDFFMHRGQYQYNKSMLSEAHYWNQNRVKEAIGRGVSPIIVDNTNVEVWHMEPYVTAGVSNGYIIEVLEPNTPWAKKANQLARKNTHDVSIVTLRRLLDNYQNGVSGVYLIRSFGLSYPGDKVPPVKRNVPLLLEPDTVKNQQAALSLVETELSQVSLQTDPYKPSAVRQNGIFQHNIPAHEPSSTSQTDSTSNHFLTSANKLTLAIARTATIAEAGHATESIAKPKHTQNDQETLTTNASETILISTDIDMPPSDEPSSTKIEDLRVQLDKIEKLEDEWENGEAWNEACASAVDPVIEDASAGAPKPPRKAIEVSDSEMFLPSTTNYNDWTKISMFMPAWNEYQRANLIDPANVKVETSTTGTSVEFGDTDNKIKNLKILKGTPKDINFYYMGPNEEKIPDKRMLDKSSMTNEHNLIAFQADRCKNEEHHFRAFRNLFKDISKVELRDIFDNCVGNVDWAVNIVLDGVKNEEIQKINSEDVSDTEDLEDVECNCAADYNVIPNINSQLRIATATVDASSPETASGPSTPKLKKEKIVSESSIQLKRQIEQNVVISDSHYSDHCLKIRKMRRGETDDGKGDSIQDETEEASASTSNATELVTENLSTDDDDSQTTCSEDMERAVNVDLGTVFISELDNMFGRSDMVYPGNISTRVNMPVSLLNEINALWIESFMYQLDQQSRQSEIMVRQDEEFARKLALKEEQLAKAGQEPAVPDLKDIMDMELALSIYRKEISDQVRSNEKNDMASRMTRDKLQNLFPHVSSDVLSEVLIAHNNNFHTTVEILLTSLGGHDDIISAENGIDKFIAKKELERHEKILQEQKKALKDAEWPLLPKDIKVDMSTVQAFRAKASEHLAQRNKYYQQAQSYFNRDLTQIASYYSDVAGLHKRRFDHANSLAAASLMQVHAANNTDNATIDLHYLRVPEAKESLDLFLDTHIQKLRESHANGGPRVQTLFFITGRGLHSPGGPRIKPAVKRRLRERGLTFTERNPGLLCSKICAEDKLTYQVP